MVLRETLSPGLSLPASSLPPEVVHAWLLRFEDLGSRRLYDLLRLRAEVFVVEQRCAYLDPDGEDLHALHLGLESADGLIAYARLFLTANGHPTRFGRVLTAPLFRGRRLGEALVATTIGCLELLAPEAPIHISAQSHLSAWYGRQGFLPDGEAYDEDGIPHVGMTRPQRR